MSEEKKYEIVGRVEIGTDEYRDLIEEKANLASSVNDYREKFWKEQEEKRKAEKEVETLKQYKEYVVEKCHDSFKLWKMEKESED